jgi:release factor glutamine methyltransferase
MPSAARLLHARVSYRQNTYTARYAWSRGLLQVRGGGPRHRFAATNRRASKEHVFRAGGGRRVSFVSVLTRFGELLLVTPPGVFAPRSDASVLLDAALPRVHGDVLDVCAGSGVLALASAPHAAAVVAVDISRTAVAAIRASAMLNRRRVEVRRGDLFQPIGTRRFDVILANPPYLPTPPAAAAVLGARAWDGGPHGRDVLDRICAEAPAHLRPGGVLLIVQSALAGVDSTLALLRCHGIDASTIAEHEGPYGVIARSRMAYLEAEGLVRAGDESERVAVICGQAPSHASEWRHRRSGPRMG